MQIKQEAYERQREMNRSASVGVWLAVFTGRLIKATFILLGAVAITLVWVAAGFGLEQIGHNLWMGLILLGIAAAVYPKTRRIAPVVGDAIRLGRRARFRREVKAGNDLIIKMGLISAPAEGERAWPVRLVQTAKEARLYVDAPLPGVSSSRIVKECREYQDRLNALRVRVTPQPNGALEVAFLLEDPLDSVHVLDAPAEFDPESMRVACAVDADGVEKSVSFKNVAGMVIGGIPGSGKTAGCTSFLLPLALSDDVDLTILDGKGGGDWEAYEPAADIVVSGDEDLEPIRDVLLGAVQEMQDRVGTNRAKLGESNFWNVPLEVRRAQGVPFKLIVIDECQGLFETAGRSKDEKEVMGEILRAVTSLVKRGRSAGVCVVLMTQKPTSEALPTAIRDNAGLRVAFRLTTSEGERAVLGMMPDDDIDVPRPTRIPDKRLGGAVMASDTGGLVEVRFYFMPEKEQVKLLEGVTEHGDGVDDDGTDRGEVGDLATHDEADPQAVRSGGVAA